MVSLWEILGNKDKMFHLFHIYNMCPGSFFIIGKPSYEQKNNMWSP